MRSEKADLLTRQPSYPGVAKTISDRMSQELVIALVGPIGSGVSTAANIINEFLESKFDYHVFPIIKPSDIIRAESYRVNLPNLPKEPLDVYVTELQTAGNELRQKYGPNYLAEKIVEKIYRFRREAGGFSEDGVPLPGRRAYIIDSLKHPEELNLLKQIYGETLCVFGVFAPDEIRASRLKDDGAGEGQVQKIMDRDKGELITFGQKTRKLFIESDFFLCNDRKKEEFQARILRFLDLIFNTAVHTPYRAESAMYEASAASAGSACMSRQVGAAIVSEKGELISVGWNDVPRFGGGLYTEEHGSEFDGPRGVLDRDHRCFKWKGCVCQNDRYKDELIGSVVKKIASSSIVKKGVKISEIEEVLIGTGIESLIEFSRAIHAEMEAILSVAREARHSLIDATLYTTTYPCHNCARHIVAAGIKLVVYIQPYEKSLATALHSDSISEDPDDTKRVVFRQYDGVAPRNYLRLFHMSAARKKDGKLVSASPKFAVPVFRVPLDSPTDYEAKVIADLTDKEQDIS